MTDKTQWGSKCYCLRLFQKGSIYTNSKENIHKIFKLKVAYQSSVDASENVKINNTWKVTT